MGSDTPTEIVPLACYRRKRYATERAASAVVFRLRAGGADVTTSKCEECRQWHLHAKRLVPAAK